MAGRSKNYTEVEKETLMGLVKLHIGVIENKVTNAVNNQVKMQTWAKIALAYNSQTTETRTADQLRECYNGRKKMLKKKVANDRMECYKTGGGTKPPAQVKVADELLLGMLGENIEPPPNEFDSSAAFLGDIGEVFVVSDNDIFYNPEPELELPHVVEDVVEVLDATPQMKSRKSPASKGTKIKRRVVDMYNKVGDCSVAILKKYKSKDDYAKEIHEARMDSMKLEVERQQELHKMGLAAKRAENEARMVSMTLESERRIELHEMEVAAKQAEEDLKMKILSVQLQLKEYELKKIRAADI